MKYFDHRRHHKRFFLMSITDRLQSAYRAAIFPEKNNKRFECTYLKASPQTSWGKRTIPFPLVFPSARLTNQKLYIWQGHPVRQSVSQSQVGTHLGPARSWTHSSCRGMQYMTSKLRRKWERGSKYLIDMAGDQIWSSTKTAGCSIRHQ